MENRCVCCGEIIPEGIQVCPNCDNGKPISSVRQRGEKNGFIVLVDPGFPRWRDGRHHGDCHYQREAK